MPQRPSKNPGTGGAQKPFAQRFQHVWKTAEGRDSRRVVSSPKRRCEANTLDWVAQDGRAPEARELTVAPNLHRLIAFPPIARRSERHPFHETDVPAESAKTQADPRLSRPDADQGRPTGSETASPKGPQAGRRRLKQDGARVGSDPRSWRSAPKQLGFQACFPGQPASRRLSLHDAGGSATRPGASTSRTGREPAGRRRGRAKPSEACAEGSVPQTTPERSGRRAAAGQACVVAGRAE